MPSLEHYLVLGLTLFAVGMLGVCLRRNLIIIFMSVELMLNAANLLLVAFARHHNNLDGQIMVFFVMVIAAAEAAVGLALIINIFRHFKSLNTESLTELKA